MPEQDNNVEQINVVRDAIYQTLGLTLPDDVITKVLEGETLSLDQLIGHHTLTEVGAALIRLDGLSKMFPAKGETSERRVCIGRWCLDIRPPQE